MTQERQRTVDKKTKREETKALKGGSSGTEKSQKENGKKRRREAEVEIIKGCYKFKKTSSKTEYSG